MLRSSLYPVLAAVGLLCASLGWFVGCKSSEQNQAWDAAAGNPGGPVTPVQMLGEIRLRQDFIPQGKHARKTYRPMYPRYITIHSTQNKTGDAYDHSRALKAGALRARKRVGGNRIGYLSWHFTVQGDAAIQHIPTREQGEHADFDGPGNNSSVGIEMCEHRGNSIPNTIERTAKLTAVLMKQHGIPISHVVPHYYWPRHGTSPLHKNCPHFLLENGRPGARWGWFLGRVKAHYARIQAGQAPSL